jgi:hypothetical protein
MVSVLVVTLAAKYLTKIENNSEHTPREFMKKFIGV